MGQTCDAVTASVFHLDQLAVALPRPELHVVLHEEAVGQAARCALVCGVRILGDAHGLLAHAARLDVCAAGARRVDSGLGHRFHHGLRRGLRLGQQGALGCGWRRGRMILRGFLGLFSGAAVAQQHREGLLFLEGHHGFGVGQARERLFLRFAGSHERHHPA